MVEWRNKDDEGRVGLLLDQSVTGVKEKVMVRMDMLWEMCSSGGRSGNIRYLAPPSLPKVPSFLSWSK